MIITDYFTHRDTASRVQNIAIHNVRGCRPEYTYIQLIQKRLSFQTLNSKHAKDDGGQILSFRCAYCSYL